MASTYSPALRLELMATGDQSGTWGDTTNTNLGTLLEQAITGYLSVAQGDVANLTLTTTNGASDQARNAVIRITGALTATRNVVVQTANKLYLINNATTGGFSIVVKTSGGTGVSVPPGATMSVFSDGTNVVMGPNYLALAEPINVALAASVGAGALTISLKGADGNDPSASNPVFIAFRNVTPATGTPTLLAVTSALSLVVPSTATMGFTSATAGRLWVGIANDGGTARLTVINCLSGTSIYPLAGTGIITSTTIGTGADSAHVFYSGTGVTAKAHVILGYMDFSLTTAGTWDEVPDVIKLFTQGDKLPGDIVQVQRLATGAVATGTTVIPFDDTIPQNTEGDQYMSQAVTPTASANLIAIDSMINFVMSSFNCFTIALFQDSVANALVATWQPAGVSPSTQGQIRAIHKMIAATTSATTFKARAGSAGAGTTTFNGNGGTRIYGGVFGSYLEVSEIMA